MNKHFSFLLITLITITSCSSNKESPAVRASPSDKEIALSEFRSQKTIASLNSSAPTLYGNSMRNLKLNMLTMKKIDALMKPRKCKRISEVLRDPKTQAPKLCQGKTVPQIIYDCPDGGMLRLKPEGDPCNPFRPQPHGSKSVRFPHNADVRDYTKEAFKVDEEDNPIAKDPSQLSPQEDKTMWGNKAHFNIN